MLSDGDKAPDFDLPSDQGGKIKLSAMQGRPVVVFFYPKDDTPSCTTEAKDFSRLIADFRARGTVVVGISPGSSASKAKFRKKHELAVLLAADADTATASAYGVWVEKSMYGRTYMGVERATFLVDRSGRIAKSWRKVRVPGHADDVLAATTALT